MMRGFTTWIFAVVIQLATVLEAETWDFSSGRPTGVLPFPREDSRGSIWNHYLRIPETFRFETEFIPLPTSGTNHVVSVLFDNMRVTARPKRNDCGLQLSLDREGAFWTPILHLGFSNATYRIAGPCVELSTGIPVRLSFLHADDQRIRWCFGGKCSDSALPCSGGIAQGRYLPTFGVRGISTFRPLEGELCSVSIQPVEKSRLFVHTVGRLAFERAEPDAELELELKNAGEASLEDVRLSACQFTAAGTKIGVYFKVIGKLENGGTVPVKVPLETRLRPGGGTVKIEIIAREESRTVKTDWTAELRIGPIFSDRMPSLMWGIGNSTRDLAEFGFTHGLSYSLGSRGPDDNPLRQVRLLDAALADGVRLVRNMGPKYPEVDDVSRYQRRTREGEIRPGKGAGVSPVPEVSHPDMLAAMRHRAVASAMFQTRHPAFAGILPCSERRDSSFPSFTTEMERYRCETGRTVPASVYDRVADLAASIKRFPDGIVPDDDPVLAYYMWFWGGGDGWPAYTGAVAEAYRKLAGRYGDGSEKQRRRPFFSFFDPAVRCPPVWGSGGDVDVLSQWDYTAPEPMNVAGPLEELFAMAEGRPGQQVMMMTQLICYRSQIAPTNVVVSEPPAWLARRPRARFPTIPPDSLQEATWSMIAKPVKGVMYHGWGTVFETGNETGYCYTNSETAEMLRKLLKEVIAPLGPFLKELGRQNSQVAILESAATCLMGGAASWGWTAPAITFLQRARLDPRVIYEQTIRRDGLAGVKVLYLPQCRFLTPSVIAEIQKLQRGGGILIGDEELLPALKPDVLVPVVSFKAPPLSDHTDDVEKMESSDCGDVATKENTVRAKNTMLRQADELRRSLTAKGYIPRSDSSTPEMIVYNRQWKSVPYVFVINDRRTFGDYVGQWGKTMEKGLPCRGEVFVRDLGERTVAVYELSRGGEMPFSKKSDNCLSVTIDFATNDGRVLMFLPCRIGEVKLSVPQSVKRGGVLEGTLHVLDENGEQVPALLPVEVRIFDANDQELDGAGWSRAVDGVCRFSVPLNLDDASGAYTVFCRDRASGKSISSKVAILENGN